MSNRDMILAAISAAKPVEKGLPVLDYGIVEKTGDKTAAFIQFVQGVGGRVIRLENLAELQQQLIAERASGIFLINQIAEAGELDPIPTDLQVLEAVQKAYIRGALGVAENGAIWVNESAMGNRILPFICQELVLVIKEQVLVDNMHEAYSNIKIDLEGYGVFIAGPSKTADIEQSLVIGAHGPTALTVLIFSDW